MSPQVITLRVLLCDKYAMHLHQCTLMCFDVLQCTSMFFNVLQFTLMYFNVLQYTSMYLNVSYVRISMYLCIYFNLRLYKMSSNSCATFFILISLFFPLFPKDVFCPDLDLRVFAFVQKMLCCDDGGDK